MTLHAGSRFGRSVLLLAALVLVAAACGDDDDDEAGSPSSDESAVLVDVGLDEPIEVQPPPRIAFFVSGTVNPWLLATIDGAEERAEERGVELTTFDAGFDPQTQFDQIQRAIDSGDFNAFIVQAIDPRQICDLVTQDAPAAGIVVSNTTAAPCDKEQAPDDDLWVPGLLNHIGATNSAEAYLAWAERIADENPGPQKVIVPTGPDINPAATNTVKALETVAEERPDFEIAAVAYGEYTRESGLTETENLLAANPDVTIVASNYTENTLGALEAIDAAGTDDVKVYDVGGSEELLPFIESGEVEMTLALYPYSGTATAVDSIVDAFAGETVERIILNDGFPTDSPDDVDFVTVENLDGYEPES